MAIDLWNTKTKYRNIQVEILKKIAKGEYKVGDEIESLEKLSQLYPECSLQSIRRATDLLAEDDILRYDPGKKLIVTENAETVISQIITQIVYKIKKEVCNLYDFNVEKSQCCRMVLDQVESVYKK